MQTSIYQIVIVVKIKSFVQHILEQSVQFYARIQTQKQTYSLKSPRKTCHVRNTSGICQSVCSEKFREFAEYFFEFRTIMEFFCKQSDLLGFGVLTAFVRRSGLTPLLLRRSWVTQPKSKSECCGFLMPKNARMIL